MRRRPANHTRTSKYGKVFRVNPYIPKRHKNKTIQPFVRKTIKFSKEVATSVAQDFIIDKIQAKQFNLRNSIFS